MMKEVQVAEVTVVLEMVGGGEGGINGGGGG